MYGERLHTNTFHTNAQTGCLNFQGALWKFTCWQHRLSIRTCSLFPGYKLSSTILERAKWAQQQEGQTTKPGVLILFCDTYGDTRTDLICESLWPDPLTFSCSQQHHSGTVSCWRLVFLGITLQEQWPLHMPGLKNSSTFFDSVKKFRKRVE